MGINISNDFLEFDGLYQPFRGGRQTSHASRLRPTGYAYYSDSNYGILPVVAHPVLVFPTADGLLTTPVHR